MSASTCEKAAQFRGDPDGSTGSFRFELASSRVAVIQPFARERIELSMGLRHRDGLLWAQGPRPDFRRSQAHAGLIVSVCAGQRVDGPR